MLLSFRPCGKIIEAEATRRVASAKHDVSVIMCEADFGKHSFG
jgi:hypothetical protein